MGWVGQLDRRCRQEDSAAAGAPTPRRAAAAVAAAAVALTLPSRKPVRRSVAERSRSPAAPLAVDMLSPNTT